MFVHFIKVAWRNLFKQKGTSLINIIGLSVGMACAVLIFFWVDHQMSYDKGQIHRDQIYRLESSWVILPPYLRDTVAVFPEIEQAIRFYFWREPTLRYGENIFTLTDFAMVDDQVFEVFNFDFIEGNPKTAIGEPNCIVLTESIAQKLFGNEEALGKTILMNNSASYTVTGVVKDINRMHLEINAFASIFDITRRDGNNDFLTARSYNFPIYLKVMPGTDIKGLEEKINARAVEHKRWTDEPLFLRPFNDIYFSRNLTAEKNTIHGNMNLVLVFSVIAVLILIIACINFINLTIAKTGTREKEIAVRKVTGASQAFLRWQFFGETFIVVLTSLVLSLLLVVFFFPSFKSLTGEEMVLSFSDSSLITIVMGVVLFTALLSGGYPALHLAALRPVVIMKGKSGKGGKDSGLSKALVAFQFTISIFLIIATLTVVRQLKYMQDKDLGFDTDQVLTCMMRGSQFGGSVEERVSAKEAFRQRLLSAPSIKGVTFMTQLPGRVTNTWTVYMTNEEEDFPLKVINGDPEFIEVMGIELMEGSNFPDRIPDGEGPIQFLLNEEAVRQLGITDPVGKTFFSGRMIIVGVVNDFHYSSLHNRIGPLAIRYYPRSSRACIKISGSDIPATLSHIERVYKEFCPGFALEYEFLDENFASQYYAERNLEKILTYFVFLAIGLSCLGLFALTAFMAERKTKEIGIRKVLGSTNSGIVILLSKNFAPWIVLANLVSWPAAYLVIRTWLQGFAYHIDVGVMVFVFSGVLALGVAVLTIGYQAIRAASADPADCLRYE